MRTLLLLFLLLSTSWTFAQDRPTGMMPMEPEKLLAALPDPPEGWKLRKSIASTEMGDWLESSAERQYERIPDPEAPEAPPSLAKVTVLDTTGNHHMLSFFKNFEVGESETSESLLVDGFPAIRTKTDRTDRLMMLVKERFVLQVLVRDPAPEDVKTLLGKCRVQPLKSAPTTPPVPLPEEITIVTFDQLNPKKNFAYEISMSTGAEVEKQIAEEEALLKRLEEALAAGEEISLEALDVSALDDEDEE